MGDPVTWGLIIAGTSTAANIYSQRKARKSRRRAAEVERRRRQIESRRASLANIEQGRQVQGSLLNVAAQTGGVSGSGVQGAISSVSSQTASNLTFNQQLLTFAEETERALEKASLSQWQAGTAGAVSSFAMNYANFKANQ